MTFRTLQSNAGPTPAAKLHQLYKLTASQNSSVDSWGKVLAAGVSFKEAEAIIRWLQNGGLPDPPHSRTIAKNAKWYAEMAARDPVASVTEVSVEAFELALRIADAGYEIEAEYVQDALTRYREYLQNVDSSEMIHSYLPPGRIFVEKWFTEIVPRGTQRMRRFSLDHVRFREYIRLTERAARRG